MYDLTTNSDFYLTQLNRLVLYSRGRVFTARYAPSPCTNHKRLDFKRLNAFTSFTYSLLSIACNVQHNITCQAKDVEYLRAYRGADKSLARPGRKQSRKHVRDARHFNNIETRAVIKCFFPLQGKAPTEIHAILTDTLACFLPGRAKDL